MLPDKRFIIRISLEFVSQCTYRCVVLPDGESGFPVNDMPYVSMHLQVRGAP